MSLIIDYINAVYDSESNSFWENKIENNWAFFATLCENSSLTRTIAEEQMRDYSGDVWCLSGNEVPHTPFWVNAGDSGSLSWSENSSLSAQQGGSGLLTLSQSTLGLVKTSPRGAQHWAIGGKPGLLIISNSSLASLQTKCHLVPTGGVWAGSLTRWQSKQQSANRESFTSKTHEDRGKHGQRRSVKQPT